MSNVYVMYSADRCLYKIGVARNVAKRLATFRTADPSIRVSFVISARNAYQLEARLHERYSWQCQGGEWFALTNTDLADIRAQGLALPAWNFRRKAARELRAVLPGLVIGLIIFLGVWQAETLQRLGLGLGLKPLTPLTYAFVWAALWSIPLAIKR